MSNIDNFKAALIGGGARANQFRVTITPPSEIAIGLDVARTSFLVKGAALPSRTITEVPLKFRGRTIYLAGDQAEPEAWEVTFLNDTDFNIKTAIERWSNGINTFDGDDGGVITKPSGYQTDLQVDHLDRDDTVLKTYILKNCWPTTSGSAIELTTDDQAAVEEFTVSWRYQYFVASGVGSFAAGGAGF